MSHTCHAVGCNTPVPPVKLMCLKHWSMVSPETKAEVFRFFRPAQCDDKKPSSAWLTAACRARLEVAEQEENAHAIQWLGTVLSILETRSV